MGEEHKNPHSKRSGKVKMRDLGGCRGHRDGEIEMGGAKN